MLDISEKFHVQGSVVGEVYLITNRSTGKIFTVNIIEKQCTCLQRQFRGFPCQHVVSALKTISPNWAEYCSPYYSVDCYRTTYVPPVFPLEDIADYPDRPMENKILHPPSPRKHGRPTSKRRRSYDEPQAEVRKMRCTQCGSTDGHNKRTCKGGDVGKNQTGYRPRTECDAANFSFTNTNRGETSTARGKAKKQGSIICW